MRTSIRRRRRSPSWERNYGKRSVRDVLRDLPLSVDHLARFLGTDERTVRSWLGGEDVVHTPTARIIIWLARVAADERFQSRVRSKLVSTANDDRGIDVVLWELLEEDADAIDELKAENYALQERVGALEKALSKIVATSSAALKE